ncbi:hypothetical protein PV10_03721 [Exophiala mesophila]|uniref:Zn(2)-C6 fungal-type domain-containing protein n=1 Tax=Exophiala mesophila TaxID=212818 RepID=A0A0D1XW23_EXOME|nr:uncharacterized protein PV10_03721 [Exophiala mesophila]KIV92421.1 hypothetical protein PV10_03721 [Exophiala mesophila]
MSKAKLRTKSGCLTCRKRKMKCDEVKPSCCNCSLSNRACLWPSVSDLYDRRNRRRFELESINSAGDSAHGCSDDLTLVDGIGLCASLLRPSPQLQTSISSECENSLLNYYVDSFLSIILLPTTQPKDYSEFRSYTLVLALECESVKHTILCSSAANKFMLTGNDYFRQISLKHYAEALKSVNQSLASIDYSRESWADPLIVSVAYLYISAFWGPDANKDAAKHVAGMQQLFKLRYSTKTSPVNVDRSFDRIMAESALYHSFLLTMRDPFASSFHNDWSFLSSTLDLLESQVYVDPGEAAKSPVIGAPPSIYRLILDIIHMFNSPSRGNAEEHAKIRRSMDYWERLLDSDASIFRDTGYGDAIELYILSASLLLDWISELTQVSGPITLLNLSMHCGSTTTGFDGEPRLRWQIARAISVLRRPDNKYYWTWCYLSSWPLTVLGYAVDYEEGINLIKEVLHDSRYCIGYAEMERVKNELEGVWHIRQRKSKPLVSQPITQQLSLAHVNG